MINNLEQYSEQIRTSKSKIIFIAGDFKKRSAKSFATMNDYSYLEFKDFLKENQIDSEYFAGDESAATRKTQISIDRWTQKIAYEEQKPVVIIDGFSPKVIKDFLTKSLLMQELVYLSKNPVLLKVRLIFVVDTSETPIEKQVLPKVLQNCEVIKVS